MRNVSRLIRSALVVAMGAVANAALAGGGAPAQVTGSVTILQRIALPPGAVITVQLADISRADAPAVVLGEQRITVDGRQAPFPFAIAYDPAAIDPRLSYAISARIENGGKLLFITDRRYPVITRESPTHVDLVLRGAR
jgi:uncharacterized lipoprotein YbaY